MLMSAENRLYEYNINFVRDSNNGDMYLMKLTRKSVNENSKNIST